MTKKKALTLQVAGLILSGIGLVFGFMTYTARREPGILIILFIIGAFWATGAFAVLLDVLIARQERNRDDRTD